jgi:flagellar operon protein
MRSIAPVDQGIAYVRNRIDSQRNTGEVLFANVLKGKVTEVRFSAHAEARLRSRNITMTAETMQKLESAIARAQEKGSQDSLVLCSDLAFIVNVPNRTVVTAMDGDSIRDNVFTNIDSTVIAD